jgi:uncharacterized protein (DUF2267 family)
MDPALPDPSGQFQDFLAEVGRRAELDSPQAERVSRATLAALGRAISEGQARQVAQWLPPELRAELAERAGNAEAFDLTNFVDSVGAYTFSVDEAVIEQQARAVFHTVRAGVPSEQIDDTLAQLPPSLAELFR